MNDKQWEIFTDFKKTFQETVTDWSQRLPVLQELQKQAAELAKTPAYSFETPVVYNRDLDKITQNDDIKLIVIGDNPGKDEQLIKNNRYLVGQAGKIADGFFKRNPQLEIDFRKNVIILNKTPIHSAKTVQLKKMMDLGGSDFCDLLNESQNWMAEKTAKLHQDLCNAGENGPELWLVGYSELKNKGLFIPYKETLKKTYNSNNENPVWDKVFVFQHFSMNRFTIDLSSFIKTNNLENQDLIESIHQQGLIHKKEIFD